MTDYKLIDSAIAPAGQNLPKVFTDGATFFSLDGTTRKVKGAFGRRLYLLSTVRAIDDFGWSLSRAVVDALVDSDVAAQAVQITNPAQIVGGNEVGQTVLCIDGRATGFPSPYNLYQWKRNGTDIPGAFREVYTRQAADIGTALTCEQRWFNSASPQGVPTVATAAAAVARSLAPTTGSIVRTAITARGTGDGSSWANAMGLIDITRAIVAAGPGGEVHVEAQNGAYGFGGTIRAGGLEGSPVTIRGVNSSTGENMKFTLDGGRGPLIDAGKSFARPLTLGGGALRLHHAYSAFTVNPANDIFILPTTETWHALITGSRVRLTTTGVLPAGLSLNTDYFVIKLAGTQQAKLATSAANATAGTGIDVTDAGTGVHTITAIAGTRTFTANATDETLTVDPLTYAEVRTGQIVYLSNSGGVLPAPLLPDRPYCVIKTSAPNVIRLSGSTRGANMVARIEGDPATDQINFTGTNSRFARFFLTGEPCIFRTSGTLPAPLVAGTTYYAVRSGANGKQGGTFKVSATANGAAIDLTDAGTGTHSIEGPVAVVKLTDAGTGTHGMRLGHVEVGPSYLTFKNMVVQNGGPGGSIAILTTSKGVTFEDIDGENLYRLIENSGYLGTSVGDASIIGMTVRNAHVYGVERAFSRLRYSSLDCIFENVSCDSRRVFGDPFASLFSCEPTSFTSVAGASNACGPCRITYLRVKASRAYQDAGIAYWNGDGGEDNGASFGNIYIWMESDWHSDGCFDCKGTCNEFINVYGAFGKRIGRFWGKGVYIFSCVFAQFQRVGEQYGENGSGALIWVGSVAYPEDGSYNATLEMDNTTLEEFTGAPLIIGGADFTQAYPMLVTNHTIRRRPNSPILEKVDTASAFFDPPIATQGPQLTSQSSFVIEKTGALNTTLTFSVAGSTLQSVTIEGGDDVDDFTLTGNVLTTGTLNIAAPADSDKDNNYRIVLRATSANGNFTLIPITVSVVAVLPTVDDFLYDDGNLITTGSANWEFASGLAGAIQVQDGHINCTTTSSSGGVVRHRKVLTSSNLYVGVMDIGASNWGSLVCARMVGSDYLGFRWQSNINETGTIQIYRYINGVLTLVTATPTPIPRPLNNETIMEVRLNPSSGSDECRVLVNGDEVIQWTPTGLTGGLLTSTRVGLHGRSALSVPWLDNFKLGVLS